jgi:hypothetical protein
MVVEHQTEHHGNYGADCRRRVELSEPELISVVDKGCFQIPKGDPEVRGRRVGLPVSEPVVVEICEAQVAVS